MLRGCILPRNIYFKLLIPYYLPGWTTTLADRLLGRGLHAVYITVSKLCSHIGHADALRLQRASLRRGPSRSTYGTVTLGEATAFTNGRREFSVRTTGWRRIHYGRHRLHHFSRCHLHYCRGRPSWRRSGLVGNPMAIAAAFSGCRFLLALLPRHSSTHFGGPAIAAH